jgi:carbamoyl-phosphate synthase large subunit
MGIDRDFDRAFAKSQLAAGVRLPNSGTVFVSVKDRDKPQAALAARRLKELGFSLVATEGTARHLLEQGIEAERVNKVAEGSPHIVDLMEEGGVHLVINTTTGAQAIIDSYEIRRTALVYRIPHYTTSAGARAAVLAIATLRARALDVVPLQSYSSSPF